MSALRSPEPIEVWRCGQCNGPVITVAMGKDQPPSLVKCAKCGPLLTTTSVWPNPNYEPPPKKAEEPVTVNQVRGWYGLPALPAGGEQPLKVVGSEKQHKLAQEYVDNWSGWPARPKVAACRLTDEQRRQLTDARDDGSGSYFVPTEFEAADWVLPVAWLTPPQGGKVESYEIRTPANAMLPARPAEGCTCGTGDCVQHIPVFAGIRGARPVPAEEPPKDEPKPETWHDRPPLL